MLPDRVSNPGPLTYESGALPIALHGPAKHSIISMSYSVMCKVYTGYRGSSEIEHGLCACGVDNPLAKARGLSLRTGAQTMLYLSLIVQCLST